MCSDDLRMIIDIQILSSVTHEHFISGMIVRNISTPNTGLCKEVL